MISTPAMDYEKLRKAAASERERFGELLAGIPYERKGILYSEMFFLWLCVRQLSIKPKRILESGRARGQSTLILARMFPDTEIVSIEYDRNSPDVPVAVDRLKNCKNVRLLYGDATRLMPKMIEQGDIVLIDGPKGFRGLRLAIELIGSSMAPLVFVHDTIAGSNDRKFLEHYLPNTLYSDNPTLAAQTHQLDFATDTDIPEPLRFSIDRSHYGYSLACLSRSASFSTRHLLLLAAWAGFRERWQRS